ncbi:MAG TPA: gliding motility lipoprotein GldB [Cyclobacteriaceae bacterium]|nr:gliding motility lipoprotein GldB [Cyclobacteriaceae bacterium]
MNLKHLFLLMTLLAAFSCKKKDAGCELSEEILQISLDINIERMENAMYEARSKEQIETILEDHPEFTALYLQEGLYESRETLVDELFNMSRDTAFLELYEEVKDYYGDVTEIEEDLENAFKYVRYHFPDFEVPMVYTFVSGFTSDLFIDEKIIVIGLDYFLPADHRFQPPNLPQYIARRYQKDYIVATLMVALSAQFNRTDMGDNTLLAEMIYYGKAYHFAKTMMPCTPDEYIIGYTTEEIRASYANEELIWSHFIENEVLFETNPFEIRKYTGEAPFTDAISMEAPGRLGRWIGWNIVDDYYFNNAVSIATLMEERDSDLIFRQSGYRPRR